MSRVRYREPSIDRHCGSEPEDIADALRALGLDVIQESRLEDLGLDQRVPKESAAALEYAGARWAVEPTAISNTLDIWAEPWMNDALKAVRKHPAFRTGGVAKKNPVDAPLMVGALLRALVQAAAEDPMLIQALVTVKTLTAVGSRGETMALMLIARGVWHPRQISADTAAWARALAAAGEL